MASEVRAREAASGAQWRRDRLGLRTQGRLRDPLAIGIGIGILVLGWTSWVGLGLDLGDGDSRLALAAAEGLAALGKVMGGWDPTVRVGPLGASAAVVGLVGWEGAGWPGVVWLPRLVAMVVLALGVGCGVGRVFGKGMGWAVGWGLLGCLGGVSRSPELGLDVGTAMALGLFTDQLLRSGSGWAAGLWLAVGFVWGGLPVVVLGLVWVVLLGRKGAYLSGALVVPSLLALGLWSGWALATVPGQAWAVALLAPLREPMGWWTVVAALGLGLPWSPLAVLAAGQRAGGAWSEGQRQLVAGWAQAAGVAALGGTLLPGFAVAGTSWLWVALVVLGVVGVGKGLGQWGKVGAWARWLGAGLCLVWVVGALPVMVVLAVRVAYYRELALLVAGLATVGMAYAAVGAWTRRSAWVAAGLAGVSLGIVLAYAGIYAPERAYRLGQGPWGRAIGQWVPPRETVYVFHDERPALMAALGRRVRRLVAPAWLEYLDAPGPHYVLLLAAEAEHWPESAPAIERIRAFEDGRGTVRVLARTVGENRSAAEP
ncbi:MAG: hypothetical protein KatS3mg108_3255 [Isosphaeraceae bacterium]|jgi:hypothetical protein|nr:MAG: hypothetical protein KatS3mg108_3255 [Isosphaeraceae bacterium]